MKIILLKNIDKLGKKGDVKSVSDGYALNFLIPKKMAVTATKDKLKDLKAEEQKIKNNYGKIKSETDRTILKIQNKKITIQKQTSEKGKLFAAVSLDEILSAIKKDLGMEVDKNQVKFSQRLKEAGEHKISLKINEKSVVLKINVKDK